MFLVESNQLLMKNNNMDFNYLESYIECQELLHENQIFIMKIKESAIIAEHYSIIKEDISILNEGVKEVAQKILAAIKNFLTNIWNKIKEYFSKIKNFLGFGKKQAEEIIKDIEAEAKGDAPEKEVEMEDPKEIEKRLEVSDEFKAKIEERMELFKRFLTGNVDKEKIEEEIKKQETVSVKVSELENTKIKMININNKKDISSIMNLKKTLSLLEGFIFKIDRVEEEIKSLIEEQQKTIEKIKNDPIEIKKSIPMHEKILSSLQKDAKSLLDLSNHALKEYKTMFYKLESLRSKKSK